ncbi:hypothetical protein SDJN03_23409, partial [Cucurbita argyrosperma subsp. sororia]
MNAEWKAAVVDGCVPEAPPVPPKPDRRRNSCDSFTAVIHVVTKGPLHSEHHFRKPTFHLQFFIIPYSFMKEL